MTSSEDDSEATYYYPLTEDEKELIRGYEKDKDCFQVYASFCGNYPTKTAINDIRAFVDANCPAAIIKK